MTATTDTRLRLAAAAVSLGLIVFAVARVSSAAFNDTTDNSPNEFVAGDVVLSDDDSDSAMFSLTNMAPGDTATKCINVTYTGSLDANVVLYGAVGAGIGNANSGLEPYLDLTVEQGDSAAGGATHDCTGFAISSTPYNGTLGGFVGSHTDFSSGNGSWAATGGDPADTVSYRFTITLQDNASAEGAAASAAFTWEAQNS